MLESNIRTLCGNFSNNCSCEKPAFSSDFFLLAESGKISLSECKACRIFTETFFLIFLSLMFLVSW